MGKVICASCGGKCAGEVLRVGDKYFHTACFICRTCSCSLAKGGFFCKDNHYYCPQDYQKSFGTRCAACGQYVEGEVVSALGNTYHQKCFTCARCKRAFPSGEKVTYTGREVVCSSCLPSKEITKASSPQLQNANASSPTNNYRSLSTDTLNQCAGCSKELAEGQALIALDRQWHTTCFRCGACGVVLQGEYMGRDGVPYCEKDYQSLYGVRCAHCDRFISGKVLQAGEKHHFHPTCARCYKCGAAFGDGEEMFLQGAAVWHPWCGPRPGDDSISRPDSQYSLRSRTPSANGSLYSPYSSLNRKNWPPASPTTRVTTYSYLAAEAPPLRKPLQPPTPQETQHFHRPQSSASYHETGGSRSNSRQRMRVGGMSYLVDAIRSETPRPKSPAMNNEEPIELSHYPSAYKPPPGTKSKIERDDFPAPPYPYTDPERRRHYSDNYKGVSDDEDDQSPTKQNGHAIVDEKLEREKRELSKLESGLASVFLKEVREREKIRQWRKRNLDPRNASRTPSATREPVHSLRYTSPVGASPSRTLHLSPSQQNDSFAYPRSHSAASHVPPYNVLHGAPRPGYGLKSSTLPAQMRTNGYPVDFTFSGLGDKTHSTDFSSGKSDISVGSITDVERSAVTAAEYGAVPRHGGATTWGTGVSGNGVSRRSLPNMATSALLNEPAKLYPYHLLLITNYRLPPDVDRLNLERHLSDAEFEAILQMHRADFYRLPIWRRNELKRRARLF